MISLDDGANDNEGLVLSIFKAMEDGTLADALMTSGTGALRVFHDTVCYQQTPVEP